MEFIARAAVVLWLICSGVVMSVYIYGLREIYFEVSPWLATLVALVTVGLFFGIALLLDSRKR
jgi:hypothetical protein